MVDIQTDADMLNRIHQMFIKLTQPQELGITDAKQAQEVANFFRKFPIIGFMQSGLSTRGKFATGRFLPQEILLGLMEGPVKEFKQHLDSFKGTTFVPLILADFLRMFARENSKRNFSSMSRGKNYKSDIKLQNSIDFGIKPMEMVVEYMDSLAEIKLTTFDRVTPVAAPKIVATVEVTTSNYSRPQVENDPNTAYVFTENNHSITAFPNRVGGGSAIIRGLANAFAIVTKKKYDYNTRENVDYSDTDANFQEFVDVNTKLINDLKNSGKSKIVFPQGFATDKAKMPERFAVWLQQALLDNFGLVTELNSAKTGLISKSTTQPSTSVKIEPTDKIIFGHPTIGKSYLKKQGEDKFITLDDDYANEVNSFVDANRGSETRQEYKGRKPKEYNEFMLNLYDRLKVQAQKEGKILFVSNTNILKERMSDFDKVITIPKVEFKRRFDERGATYGFEDWKSEIDAAIAKVPANKVITTTGYLSDLLPTQSSTSVNEFDIADNLTPIKQNFADGQGGRQMQDKFKGKSTMDLIISGDRTRTTRAKTDIQRMTKEYGLSKISDLVGKVIRMTDKTGKQAYTKITKVAPFTQEYQDATWQKEGWVKSVTDKHVGDYPYAIEFEVVNRPTQSSVQPQAQTTGTNNPEDYTNHSGGAYGGDTFWDIIGREFGVTKHKHYRDAGNASLSAQLRKSGITAEVLTKDQMDNARAEVERILGKKYPDTTEGNLKVRNFYQVANSDGVFAVAELRREYRSVAERTAGADPSLAKKVKGGTDVAIQLGIALNKPTYVWDMGTKKWHQWDSVKQEFVESATPVLTKNFAGVGSRDIESYNVKNEQGNWVPRQQYKGKKLEDAAKQAIKDVYANTFKKNTQLAGQVKPGVVELFESNPELVKIGTEQQYSDWIKFIITRGKFAGTQSTDILYHGAYENFEEFDDEKKGSNTGINAYQSEDKSEQFYSDSAYAFFFSDHKTNAISYTLLGRDRYLSEISDALQDVRSGQKDLAEDAVQVLKEVPYFKDLIDNAKKEGKTSKEIIELLGKEETKLSKKYKEGSSSLFTNELAGYENSLKELNKFLSNIDVFKKNASINFKNSTGNFKIFQKDGRIQFARFDKGRTVITGERFYADEVDNNKIKEFIKDAITEDKSFYKQTKINMKVAGFEERTMPVLLNLQNPSIHDYEKSPFADAYKKTKTRTAAVAAKQVADAIKNQNDGVIYKNVVDPLLSNSYGVFSTKQIYNLGGKEDIEGFKNFVIKDNSPTGPLTDYVSIEDLQKNPIFEGMTINFLKEIQSNRDKPIPLKTPLGKNRIDIVADLMYQKYEEKAWTVPATQLDGSKATPLAENQFGSYNEFLTFALLHEKAHKYILKQENETIGQYEDRINDEAMRRLNEIPNREVKNDRVISQEQVVVTDEMIQDFMFNVCK
jgi:hypothetical protein